MKYDVISADCHVDLIWLPPDLFTANAPAAVKERMPYVTDGPRGKEWVTKSGSSFGLMNGMGSAGRLYEPGKIHRSDRMASTGLYEDGKNGIRRLTDPDLRLKEQDRDGVQAEVLYGILGATNRLNDDEAAGTMLRIYNDWLADFCGHHPERFAGLANIALTRPDIVAAGNIGCITQLQGEDAPIPVVHTVELLDWATGGPAPTRLARLDRQR